MHTSYYFLYHTPGLESIVVFLFIKDGGSVLPDKHTCLGGLPTVYCRDYIVVLGRRGFMEHLKGAGILQEGLFRIS